MQKHEKRTKLWVGLTALMSEPDLPLWNSDQSDVLPRFQLTYGHSLFRGLLPGDFYSLLFESLGLSKARYQGPMKHGAVPLHPRERCHVLGSATETHWILAQSGDVLTVFGPHDFFLSNALWIGVNSKAGGIMAVSTMISADSLFYDLFRGGVKQTNAVAEGKRIRVVPDAAISAYIGEEKIFEDKGTCSLLDAEVRDLIQHDLAITVDGGQLSIGPRFSGTTAAVEAATHFIFQRGSPKKSFLGIRIG